MKTICMDHNIWPFNLFFFFNEESHNDFSLKVLFVETIFESLSSNNDTLGL